MDKLLQNLAVYTYAQEILYFYKKHTLAKSSLESIQKFCFGSILICFDF
jgi:hypothetical protein